MEVAAQAAAPYIRLVEAEGDNRWDHPWGMDPAEMETRERELVRRVVEAITPLAVEIRTLAAAGSPLGRQYADYLRRLESRARSLGIVPPRGPRGAAPM